MSKRKLDARPKHVITVTPPKETPDLDPPLWTDPLRGILIALIEQNRQLWDTRYNFTKEKCLQIFVNLANILNNQDNRITGFFVLEKMCYMTEMLYRSFPNAVNKNNQWRYENTMSFLRENEGNGAAFLNCISKQRFAELCTRYGKAEELAISKTKLPPLPAKLITGVFKDEMNNFYNYVKGFPPGEGDDNKSENGNDSDSDNSDRPIRRATRSMGNQPGKPNNIQAIMESLQGDPDLELKIPKEEPLDEYAAMEHDPVVPLSPQSKQSLEEKIPWTKTMNVFLIETIRVHPIIWHHLAPGFHDLSLRKQELAKVLRQLKTMPGGEMVDEQDVEKQWALIRSIFDKHYQKLESLSLPSRQSGWDLYAHLQFLSPQVMAACRFGNVHVEDIPPRPHMMMSRTKVETMATNLIKQKQAAVDAEACNQLEKILGYIPSHLENASSAGATETTDNGPPCKMIAIAPIKQEVQQVVATWVPPKEHSLAAAMLNMNKGFGAPTTSAGPTATAEITTSSCPKLLSLLLPVQEHPEKITKVTENGVVHDKKRHEKPIEDKWTSLGRMVEHTCRDVEARNLETSIKLQKEINDILYKYQMESLPKPPVM